MTVPRITCVGDAYRVGHQHGSQAAEQVKGSIYFYKSMLEEYTGMTWDQIADITKGFEETIRLKWPDYFLEMQGIADGAGCSFSDVVALNVRTEIAFGLMDPNRFVSDGCTSLAWTGSEKSCMGQNWDWMEEQKNNLIFIEIRKTGMPVIKMITEGGIIGKIGMNSEGLGVCLNAVRCRGFDANKLPIHLALRTALESVTVQQAVRRLESTGTAGSGFILLGQGSNARGLEFTSKAVFFVNEDGEGRLMHSNHLLSKQDEAEEWPEDDSFDRLERLRQLTEQSIAQKTSSRDRDFIQIFDDHEGYPTSICRSQEGKSMDATLFSIMMNLLDRSAKVVVGRLCKAEEIIEFNFSD